ncbi:MAG TPA: GNAT family N-acetyltransferase [Mycobacteriales bacterium]|nr:GNAT family N-acetyltransferase [Mycobacteriales bacterium]
MLKLAGLRLLDDRDRSAVAELLAADPVGNCFVAARIESGGLAPWRLGAEMWGYGGSTLEGACYSGANLVPVGANPVALRAFAERARRQGRRCSSIAGRADAVGPLWDLLRPYWGRPREVRARQPLLAIGEEPLVRADPSVRRVWPNELDILLPACVAMFIEEVGVSPIGADGGSAYRRRIRDLVRDGRAYARIEDGEVVYKAEVGAVSAAACQIQGVWVSPSWRGHGLGTAGTAAVVHDALRNVAPMVSLYVNEFNAPAMAAYRRCGFTDVGTFSTVLF